MSPFLLLFYVVSIIFYTEPIRAQSSYIFINISLDWSTAESYCASTYSTNLASLHSNEDVTSFWTAASPFQGKMSGNMIWVGLSDISIEGIWIWSDATALDFTNWFSGEPNDFGGNENCVSVYPDSQVFWNDQSCSLQYPFVCNNVPTITPTTTPSKTPTITPTNSPSNNPTINPSNMPSKFPTNYPSKLPTVSPVSSPTISPTFKPTNGPTDSPAVVIYADPSSSPTDNPSDIPTPGPTRRPTQKPTLSCSYCGGGGAGNANRFELTFAVFFVCFCVTVVL